MIIPMNDFISWLNDVLLERGWSNAELARRMGLTRGAISMTLNGVTAVTWEFCFLVAKALGIPPEEVFRKAGLLPPAPRGAMQKLTDQARYLNEDNLELLIDLANFLYKRQG